jgi:Acetyltransferase (GNAT) domain
MSISIQIFTQTNQLPSNWDEVAWHNIFLQKKYLQVLQESAPVNMRCFYMGFFQESSLIGCALAQYIDISKLESFGDRDANCIKTKIRNTVFRNFAGNTLFIGNNMITGQNAYTFNIPIDREKIAQLLKLSANELKQFLKKEKINIHIVSFKDFYKDLSNEFIKYSFSKYYNFNTQPNMIFQIPEELNTKEEYIALLEKKYRDQYKRAHKRFEGIVVKDLTLEEIENQEDTIYQLYQYVARNAPFNTFFLAKNHFSNFKKNCGDLFKIVGYFYNEVLVGFHTVLINGNTLETYFLGYNETIQKDKMLYLNMLYNMLEYGIENGFKRIIFGRTALEIKSSIGAVPVEMNGFIYHTNTLIDRFMPYIFQKLEPETTWQQRHPFKK